MRGFATRSTVIGAFFAVVLATASAGAIMWLQSYASNHEQARVALAAVSAETATLSQLEWQAVAQRGVDDELFERAAETRARAREALATTIAQIGPSDGVESVARELQAYLSLTRSEFGLLAAGRLEDAEKLDEEQVDPTFERLREAIAGAQAVAARQAHEADRIARLGTVLMLVLGLAASGLLFWRLSASKKEAQQAFFDPLTGLANRMLLTDRLSQALTRAERVGSNVGVLFVDIDDFKRVNDTLGHAAGDTLLRAVADRLRETVRACDTVGRLGGDEFALVLDGDVDADGAADAAARLTEMLSEPFAIAGHSVTMTVSIGCAVSEPGVTSGDELLRNADLAMYAGKRQGKRRVVMYEPSMYEALADRMQLEIDLRHALARDEISVAYQPIVEVETGRLRSLEALARWTHPVRGVVGPALFIPLAEETGMIREIGRHVLREAARQLHRWQAERLLLPPLGIAVNLSPVQLQDGEIVDDVRRILREADVDPSALTLEITESVLVERGDSFQQTLEALNGLGVTLAIDDFGTGYSSLASLTRFPIHVLKIDRSFVTNLTDENGGLELVRSIVELGRALGLDAVAEGIETAEQAEILNQLACGYGQGYHYAHPLTPADADQFIADRFPTSDRAPEGRRNAETGIRLPHLGEGAA